MVLPSGFKLRKITTLKNQRSMIQRVSSVLASWRECDIKCRNKDKEVSLSDLLCAG